MFLGQSFKMFSDLHLAINEGEYFFIYSYRIIEVILYMFSQPWIQIYDFPLASKYIHVQVYWFHLVGYVMEKSIKVGNVLYKSLEEKLKCFNLKDSIYKLYIDKVNAQ